MWGWGWGCFVWVISAGTLALVAWAFDDFSIAGFWPAVLGAIIVSLTGWLASWFIGPRGRVEVIYMRRGTTGDRPRFRP